MRPFLKKILPHEEIGWTDIGETFTRFTLARTPWFRVYLHYLHAPEWHPHCHDHPWSFIAILLKTGYFEMHDKAIHWRGIGSVLYRPAEWRHNVLAVIPSWSLIITGPKRRQWGFTDACSNST